jgi:hypothetical protein
MKDLLDKLSSYNIFNNLLPGVLFAAFVDATTSIRILQKDIVVGVFLYYFLGAVVSRVGSLIVEPVLIAVGFVRFAPYSDFIKAVKADPKIDILSETNNMYRTLCALMLCVSAVSLYDAAAKHYKPLDDAATTVCLVALSILFLVSYRKQTSYITKRVEASKP